MISYQVLWCCLLCVSLCLAFFSYFCIFSCLCLCLCFSTIPALPRTLVWVFSPIFLSFPSPSPPPPTPPFSSSSFASPPLPIHLRLGARDTSDEVQLTWTSLPNNLKSNVTKQASKQTRNEIKSPPYRESNAGHTMNDRDIRIPRPPASPMSM